MDNSISLDISNEVYSERRIVKNNQEHVQQQGYKMDINETDLQQTSQKHIGRMISLSRKWNLSLGPNYSYFFIGCIMTLTVSILLVYCAFTLIKAQDQESLFHKVMKILSLIMAIWVNISYLITALSDPGIYKLGKLYISQNENLRDCSKCKIRIPDNVRHCFSCDVCIIELDHHCPWMSKCVGRGNLRAFYAFVGGFFLMMGLFWINVFMMLAQ